ncbi:hypothetical protein CCHR01_18833 [Colletotrichum chrysophilum]|uniref:Uncharacterized protein n=1 Tax=Colletotrichum chrysophilum TaxID=1836956 RepID=A0AAD9A0V8_9PEZI|nr:hypothetical protein CCHR01_18833 [Colletotrichum chrysophilum]
MQAIAIFIMLKSANNSGRELFKVRHVWHNNPSVRLTLENMEANLRPLPPRSGVRPQRHQWVEFQWLAAIPPPHHRPLQRAPSAPSSQRNAPVKQLRFQSA